MIRRRSFVIKGHNVLRVFPIRSFKMYAIRFVIRVFSRFLCHFAIALVRAARIDGQRCATRSNRFFFFRVIPGNVTNGRGGEFQVIRGVVCIIQIRILGGQRSSNTVNSYYRVDSTPSNVVFSSGNCFIAASRTAVSRW